MENMNRRSFLKLAGAAVAAGMDKRIPNIIESQEKETIPTEESVQRMFEVLRGEHSYHERRKLPDDQGVYLWEVEFQIEGGTAEFGYMRAGKHAVGGSATHTKVYVYYFDEDGMPKVDMILPSILTVNGKSRIWRL